MKRFEFDFRPPSEPRKVKLSLPEDLVSWYEQQASSNGGTLEAGILQALLYVRQCQEEPEPAPVPGKRVRNRKPAQPPEAALQEV